MPMLYVDLSMSLDGFITGPNPGVANPLGGASGERLHAWMFDRRTEADAKIRDEKYERTGAIIIGKRMFDEGVEPWGDPPPFNNMPVFVVTHEDREPLPRKGGTTYTFVTTGIEAALDQANSAAAGKDVGVWGGAEIARQYLDAGLLDELQIHLMPVLLGAGVRLFADLNAAPIELERTRTVETPSAIHIWYSVLR